MTEQTRNNGIKERIVSGLAERGYTLKEMLSTTLGPSGSIVFKGEYGGRPVALKIASYGLLDSFAGDNVEKLKDFRRREIETLRLAGNHPNMPGYIDSFDIDDRAHDPIYVLAMEYLDYPSIAARIMKGERASDEEAKILLKDGLSAENHLHTGLPTQVLHRDMKTKNVLLNEQKAYVIDFDIVKQGTRESTRATLILPNGYYPKDFYDEEEETQKPEHDVVALGNVAIAGISGKEIGPLRYEQGRYGLDPVDTGRLNVSPEIRKYLARMIAPPGQRFQTAREALEGLERIIGLPAVVQPQPQPAPVPERQETQEGQRGVEKRDDNLPETSKLDEGLRRLGVLNYKGKITNPHLYEALRHIKKEMNMHLIKKGDGFFDDMNQSVTQQSYQLIQRYMSHVAQQNPILAPVAEGTQTLEGMLREVEKSRPSLTKAIWRTLNENLGPINFMGHYINNSLGIALSDYRTAKQAYNQRRADLLKVFGMNEEEYIGIDRGISIIGGGGGTMAALVGLAIKYGWSTTLGEIPLHIRLPVILGGASLGAIGGKIIPRYIRNRKLSSQARKIDSMLQQARNSQIPLEKRVEMARLNEGEEKAIGNSPRVVLRYLANIITPIMIGAGANVYSGSEIPFIVTTATAIGTALVDLFGKQRFLESIINHYLSQAQKAKRRLHGVPEDGMAFSERLRLPHENLDYVNTILDNNEIKGTFKRRRNSNNIRISLDLKSERILTEQPNPFYDGRPGQPKTEMLPAKRHFIDIEIRTNSKDKLEQIVTALEPLRPLRLPAPQTEQETPKLLSKEPEPGWSSWS